MLKFEIVGEGYDFSYENAVYEYEDTQNEINDRLLMAIQEADMLLEAMLSIEDYVLEAGGQNRAKLKNGARAATNAVSDKVGSTVDEVSKYKNGTKSLASNTSKTVKAIPTAATGAAVGANKVVKGVKKTALKAKEMVQKVIQFIKNMFSRLVDTLQTWFQNSGKWLEARKDQFEKFNYNDLSITMIPYWEGEKKNSLLSTSRDVLQYIADGLRGGVNKAETTFEGFTDSRLKNYLDVDGDLTEGLKNYYRVGVAKGKDRVDLSSSVLKNQVLSEMIPTILKYDEYIKKAENVNSNLMNRTSVLASEIDKRSIATESALFKSPYHLTEFANFEEFDYLLESTPGSSDTDRTKVEINKDKRANDEKKEDNKTNKFSEEVAGKSDDELKILNNVLKTERIMMSCYFTVMQERYTAYMNALKAIWSASNTVGGRNTPKEKKQ